ncbi:gamma-glutamyltransferase [Aquicoccus sp. G2-2]|uniref:gamma-glutamyltransferase n=1 Tax=Aquicoccus sp. G2-2 TaxID=3092120 RepID=UPI002AE0647E|nr:gamma-glutamyltransferase [Aquicoccus sp. G2-2]MEA1113896.1 gamma-glutamyltransferase [Aquicoccus sp. G2-2]
MDGVVWTRAALTLGAVLAVALFATGAGAQDVADSVAPEPATALSAEALSQAAEAAQAAKAAGKPVAAKHWMIVAANPYAVEAGAKVLADGGTAADAMVAAQAMLGLVEPQSSGLGGGGFLLWYDAKTGTLTSMDARETAPLAANPTLFQDKDGKPLRFFDAVVGGRAVGVPGIPELMRAVQARWGKKNWASLFTDAIERAETGFPVSARLAGMVAADVQRLSVDPEARAYFVPGGFPVPEGHILKNPAYGETLRMLAGQGVGQFYGGKIAKDIVAKVQGAKSPGLLSEIDMGLYKVKERAPVCAPYRGLDVCGMGPPSSGGLTVGMILGVLDQYDLAALGPQSPQAWRLIGDASRLAFADRARYIADSDYVPVPMKGLLAPGYLTERAELLTGDMALPDAEAGKPEFDHAGLQADDDAIELPSTSHLSIVDSAGNVLVLTSSVENAFGSRLMVRGFLLNNQLTDFSFSSQRDGRPIANRVEPGKRPRSSMAPTIVLRNGKPVLAIGSPGGSRIIGYVAQAIIAWVDWGMDVQQAVAMPHLVNRFGPYEIEQGTSAQALSGALEKMGYGVNVRGLNSGLHAIAIGDDLRGGADPRREGIALGQ